jgi:parallel beta-helix repeat protein
MFSATGLIAAFAILALSVNVIDTDPPPPNQAGATHVVATDGSGDFDTIQAAVDAAEPGDLISIAPGTYVGSVLVEKDLTLAGDGPRDDVIISLAEDQEMLLEAPAVALRDLTVTGELSNGIAARGGSPVVERVHFLNVGKPYVGGSACANPCRSLAFRAEADGTVRDSDFTGGGAIEVDTGANALIEGNRLSNGPHVALFDIGDGTVVRGNSITMSKARGIGTFSDSSPLIEGNQLQSPGYVGIDLWDGSPVVRDNVVTDAETGIAVLSSTSSVALQGNELTGNRTGITWEASEGVIDGNSITDGQAGLFISRGAPTLAGNNVCDNSASNLTLGNAADPVDDGSNEICEDAPAE